MHADDGFRELDRQECLRLLAAVPVGRLVYTRQALPAVLPLNFSLDGDGAVLLRTSASSPLVKAVDGAIVALEADEVDPVSRSGWSVVVTGLATQVTDPQEHARLLRTGPRSWAPGPREIFLRIEAELVTGRQLYGGAGPFGVHLPASAP
ncbi:pyridoxamine 5'-phosphate oxidase family protein [Streptomyces sp. NPDC048566]|uniref:pyridoxamine 5'-phosphate oxidase family protein n=1 Tax=Streptomyces sp. NPDC048566 TaxID=3365569 RepID=UPI0037146419